MYHQLNNSKFSIFKSEYRNVWSVFDPILSKKKKKKGKEEHLGLAAALRKCNGSL